MSRTSRTQSNDQKSEAQRSESLTSSEGTAKQTPDTAPDGQLSVLNEHEQIQDQLDTMLGVEDEVPESELISVKTNGPYLLHDPTTGDTVEESGGKVRNSQFIKDNLEAGRISEA
jgi:hypothetical protein